MAAMGVRSSWEASPTNRRRRASDSRSRSSLATRARKADSIRVSMTLRVRARRPTSVLSFSPGTRSVRLPSAIDSAVVSMSRSGRSPMRTSQKPASSATRTAPAVTISSITLRWLSVLSVSLKGWARIRMSPLATVEARTRKVGPPEGEEAVSKKLTCVPSAACWNPVMGQVMTGV
jgi:hypothetical protein